MTIGNVKKRGEVRVSKGSVVFGWRAPRPPRVVFVLGFVSLINLSLQAKTHSLFTQFPSPVARCCGHVDFCNCITSATPRRTP